MRKLVILTMLAAMLAVGVSVVQAQPPVSGTYKTQDGDFLEGRSSTAWPSAADARLTAGNVLHAQSFDGANLGTEWDLCGMMIVNVQLIADLVFDGLNGQRIYLVTYGGGTATLDGGGPWGGGDPQYDGIIDSYNETRTIQWANGKIVGANSNHNLSAHLLGYTSGCIAWAIGNGALVGDTDPASDPIVYDPAGKPMDYPAYVDNACGAAMPQGGRWGTFTDLTLTVQGCAVPVENQTWGGVKKIYE
jgi:hypothetical protein